MRPPKVTAEEIIEAIKTCHDHYGRIPTFAEFRQFTNNRYVNTIYTRLGGYGKAIGHIYGYEYRRTNARGTDGEMLAALRRFYETVGRSPAGAADFKTELIPYSLGNYSYRFGNLNLARLKAGIPAVIRVGGKNTEVDAEEFRLYKRGDKRSKHITPQELRIRAAKQKIRKLTGGRK